MKGTVNLDFIMWCCEEGFIIIIEISKVGKKRKANKEDQQSKKKNKKKGTATLYSASKMAYYNFLYR